MISNLPHGCSAIDARHAARPPPLSFLLHGTTLTRGNKVNCDRGPVGDAPRPSNTGDTRSRDFALPTR